MSHADRCCLFTYSFDEFNVFDESEKKTNVKKKKKILFKVTAKNAQQTKRRSVGEREREREKNEKKKKEKVKGWAFAFVYFSHPPYVRVLSLLKRKSKKIK